MLESTIVIDGRDHLLGRLASVVAKELLAGQKVVIVRCESIVVSGSLVRNRVKYAQFRQKKMNTNPRKGPFHFRNPAKFVYRTIRGMCHQKSARGQEALTRLSTFEGIPAPFDKQSRKVIPAALRVIRLKPGRNYTVLAELLSSVGWKHKELLERLEEKRKADASEYWAEKKKRMVVRKHVEMEVQDEMGDGEAKTLLMETGNWAFPRGEKDFDEDEIEVEETEEETEEETAASAPSPAPAPAAAASGGDY